MKTSSHSAPSLRVLVRSSAGPTSTSSVVWVRQLARDKDSVVSAHGFALSWSSWPGLVGARGVGEGLGSGLLECFGASTGQSMRRRYTSDRGQGFRRRFGAEGVSAVPCWECFCNPAINSCLCAV